MLQFTVENVWSFVKLPIPRACFDEVMSYYQDNYWFTPSYRAGRWDGRIRFYSVDQHNHSVKFPSGFLPSLCRELSKRGFQYTIQDNRILESFEPAYSLLDDLGNPTIHLDRGQYSYQAGVVDLCLTYGRGVVRIATGGGKTEIGAAIIKSIGKSTIWLTDRKRLFYQTRERLAKRLGVPIGAIGDGLAEFQNINVMMVQSVVAAKGAKNDLIRAILQHSEVVIGDEIHHLPSASWSDTFSDIRAPYRFGLTATTNLEGEALAIRGLAGDIIADVPATKLIDCGVAVPPRIWFVTCDYPVLDKKLDGREAYNLGIVENQHRTDLIGQICSVFKMENKGVLVLVNRIKHGKNIVSELKKRGLTVKFIEGKTPEASREKHIEDFKTGDLDSIVAMSTILGEGVDMPFLRAVVNATGTAGGGNKLEGQEGRQTIQFLGRTLRRFPGKAYCDYVDVADFTHESLKRASFARVSTLEAEGYTQFVKRWSEYQIDESAATARV